MTGVEFMPEGISDIGDNEDIDSIVKKYRTETDIGALNLAAMLLHVFHPMKHRWPFQTSLGMFGFLSCEIDSLYF